MPHDDLLFHPGKTLFLAFALLRCLERHWTVVLQTHPSFLHIFNSVGAWKVCTRDVDLYGLHCAVPKATWCLLDSNEGVVDSGGATARGDSAPNGLVHFSDALVGPNDALVGPDGALVNPNEALLSVPQHIIDLGRFIVQAALPEHRRTSWQDKVQMIVSDYVMRPMGVEEAPVA